MIRIVLGTLAILASAMPGAAWGDPRSDVRTGMAQCDGLADDHVWLDCLDGVTQRMRAHLTAQPIPGAAPLPQATPFAQPRAPTTSMRSNPPALPQAADFGLRQPVPASAPRATSSIRTGMTQYTFNRFGMFTVTLADGQVWRQVDGDTSQAHWGKPAESYTVNIRRAALGSFSLTLDGEGGAFKVRRVK